MNSIIEENKEQVNIKCIIVDLDGTLANCEHRQHFVQAGGKKDWKSFFNGMYEDEVNEPLNELIKTLHQHYDVYFVTARPSNYYGKTISWLYDKADWPKGEYQIRMRSAGDFRPDSIVKKELLDSILAEGKTVLAVFDDRKAVVDMWRTNGILTCQVADHDF